MGLIYHIYHGIYHSSNPDKQGLVIDVIDVFQFFSISATA